GRYVEQLRRRGLRQAQHVGSEDDRALPLCQLGQLDKQIDLAVTARDVGGVTQRGEWPKDPVPPAMALPGPGGDDEHPPFRLRDDAVLAERIFERVLKRVRSILRTCTHSDQRPVDLRVRRFACEQPLRASETLGNL